MAKVSLAHPAPPSTRPERALALVENFGDRIERLEAGVYLVPSQDGERVYEVTYGRHDESCECPDHTHRGATCVHIIAVGILNARRRGDRTRRILEEAIERYNHELLDDEERMVLLDRIKRLKKARRPHNRTV